MTQVTETAPKLYKLLLPGLTLAVTDFTLSGGRQFREEPTVASDSRMISPGVWRHTLALTGFVPDGDAAALMPKLEELCDTNTSLSFSFAGIAHRPSLQYASIPSSTLHALKKNLLAHWCYTKKVDNKKKRRYNRIKRQEEKEMAGTKSPRYSEEFKKTIVNLHQNGKSYAEIEQEYGVSHSALAKWIKQYSAVRLDDDTLITAEQIKALQKRNAQLEEENLILKKAIAIFTPHSDKD